MPRVTPESARGLDVDGILLLDKPAGPTSNQALQRAKRLYGARKAGHAGTLDPLATGLLPLLFGEATKFASYLSNASKTYEATLLLGTTTTTGDLAGDVVEQRPACVTARGFEAAVARFRGVISQIPPMYSALKVEGRPLYERARRGEVVDRAAREVSIDELSVLAMRDGEADIRVRCSKGTYIRVLGEDIGRTLGCGATLTSLRRTGVGPFEISAAFSFEALQDVADADRLHFLRPIEAGLDHVPRLMLDTDEARRLRDGQPIVIEETRVTSGTIRLYHRGSDSFLGLGTCTPGLVRALRLVTSAANLPSSRFATAK